jgi:hypothetical protein
MSDKWGIKWTCGSDSGWYGHLGLISLGTEAEARDKADRLNDKDVEGKFYRAQKFDGLMHRFADQEDDSRMRGQILGKCITCGLSGVSESDGCPGRPSARRPLGMPMALVDRVRVVGVMLNGIQNDIYAGRYSEPGRPNITTLQHILFEPSIDIEVYRKELERILDENPGIDAALCAAMYPS